MTRSLSNKDAVARVVSVLKQSFGPNVTFELFKESDTVYRVKATSDDDASIADGVRAMKAARLRSVIDDDVSVKMLSEDDVNDYSSLAASTNDPILRAGYQVLAEDAGGK